MKACTALGMNLTKLNYGQYIPHWLHATKGSDGLSEAKALKHV